MILLVLFTHFVLTELKPLDGNGVQEITPYEWLIYIWMLSFTVQEAKQVCSLSFLLETNYAKDFHIIIIISCICMFTGIL